MRPLYQLSDEVQPALGRDGHRGLWYDKFCDKWSDDSWSMKAEKGPSPKLEWIRTVEGAAGSLQTIHAYARRLFDLIEARGGEAVVVKAQSRFVTGLGRSHPVENGFVWHPTLGTPYLPGSSVKGLTRAYAMEDEEDRAEVERLLGDPGRAGTVALLDAIPLGPVTLEADVLTPHYANWTVDEPPADWQSPTPIPFLVAAPGWSMLCGIVPLRPGGPGDTAMVKDWLTSALTDAGAGAKTAVGYGQFRVDKQDTTLADWQRERRQREAGATPEERWRVKLEGRTEEEILDVVREHLDKNPLPDLEDRQALVRVVLDTKMVKSWKRGERVEESTRPGPKKLKAYAQAVLKHAAEFGLEPPQ